MQQIMDGVAWVQANWLSIVSLITSIIGVASIIVKFTPTQADDAILAKIIAFLSKWIALNPTPKK